MSHDGISGPQRLAFLTQILDEYCLSKGIPADSYEREEAGHVLMTLDRRGSHSVEELKAKLASAMNEHHQPGT